MKISKGIIRAICDYCFGRRERRKEKRRESDRLGYINTVEEKEGHYTQNGVYLPDRRSKVRRKDD